MTPWLHYYFSPDARIVELKVHETYIEEEIELLVPQIGISLETFKELYQKAKKHKL